MIANLVLCFIALCLAGSRVGNWRPYRFLDDAEIGGYDVQEKFSMIYFTSPKQMEDLVVLADAELASLGLVRHMYEDMNRGDASCGYVLADGSPNPGGSVLIRKSLGRTVVIVTRPPTISDRIRSILSRLF